MIKNFYKYGGGLNPHTPSYVKRFADDQLYELLKQNYFCYVFNCRQMGKSSLQAQVKMRLEATNAQGNQCVYLTLQEMDCSQSISENQWYREFSKKIFRNLNLQKQTDFNECWSRFSGQGAISSSSDFMAEILLPSTSSNLVIFIDEIDRILELSFRDNFFGLIRTFHEKRAEYDDFNRLTFCFLGVATPNDLIQNPLQSPFNIGRAIELRGFEFNESLVLAQGLQDVASVPEEVLREILFWTGGQPFLTQKVCALLVESQVRIGEGQEKSFIEEFIYSSIIRNWEGQDEPIHLRSIKNRLLAKEVLTGKLLEIYRHILQNGYFTTEGNQLESELRLSGLVVKRNADLEIFNPIYREVFSLEWVQKQLDSLRPYAVALNAWLASEKNNAYLLDDTETARADIWREGKFLTREDEEFIRDSKLAQKDKDSAQKIEAEREAKKILEKAKKKAQKALIGSIIASALIIAGTLIFAIIQTTKAEKASQEANKSMQNLTNIKKERDKIGQEVIRANDRLSQVSVERRQIEVNARQRLAVAQGNLKQLETARNQAQQQVTQFQRQKTILERERQIILAQKLEAESRMRKSQGELQEIKGSLQVNRQRLEEVNRNLQKAEQAQQVTIKLTQLEQRGINISRRFENGNEGQITLLLEALEVGQELQNVAKSGFKNEYSTPNFLLALHTIINGIQEKNRLVFKGELITLSPNAQYIVILLKDNTIHLLDIKGNLIVEFKGQKSDVISVAFSPDEKYLATGSRDGTVRFWDIKGNLIVEFKGQKFDVISVAFSPDEKYLATGSADNTAQLWDLKGNLITEFITEFRGHQDFVKSVVFSPDGKYLATGSSDSTARLWDLKGNVIAKFNGHKPSIISLAFSPDGKYLATGSSDGARLWDLKGNLITEFKEHQDFVESVVFSPGGKYLATGSFDGTVRLWDLKGNVIAKFNGHESSVISVAFSPDGKYLATGSSDDTARLWGFTGNLITEFRGHKSYVFSVSLSPDGKYLATGSWDGTARLWDLKGNLITEFKGHQHYIYSVAFSPDGKFLATGSSDGTARLWDLKGNVIAKFNGHKSIVTSVAFSPDKKYLATGSSDGTARLWDFEGNLITEFKGHQHDVYSVAFSPDGKYLATGSSDRTARLWDLKGNVIVKFNGHKFIVTSIAFSPDGKYLATGSRDDTARLWRVEELDDLLVRGCHWLKDYFVSHPRDLQELPVCQQALKTSR